MTSNGARHELPEALHHPALMCLFIQVNIFHEGGCDGKDSSRYDLSVDLDCGHN